MQIVKGVYLVNGFPYGIHENSENSYLIRTDSAAFMVDCGEMNQETFPVVERSIESWGFELDDVSHLFVTHAHYDHSSNAGRLRRLGVKIVASKDTADAIAAGDERCIPYVVSRPFERCETDVVVEDDSVIDIDGIAVRCIAAPGHADGMMIFEVTLNGAILWFTGDLIEVGPESRSLQLGWPGGPDFDRGIYLKTLKRLSGMTCDVVLPGHGPPLIGGGKRLIDMAYTRALVEWR